MNEVIGVVFCVAYVVVGASGMLVYGIEAVQLETWELKVAHVRSDGVNLWSYGDDGWFEAVDLDGNVYRIPVGTVVRCHQDMTIVGGTVIADATKVYCVPDDELGGYARDDVGERLKTVDEYRAMSDADCQRVLRFCLIALSTTQGGGVVG